MVVRVRVGAEAAAPGGAAAFLATAEGSQGKAGYGEGGNSVVSLFHVW